MKQDRHIKIAIESMQRCPGACSGCMLGDGERKGAAALGIDMEAIGTRAERLTAAFLATPGENEDASAVHLTQGDHLLLDAEAIDNLVGWARGFTHGKLDLLISTSAIGTTRSVEEAVRTFKDASERHGQDLTLLVVFDPAKALNAKFGETYSRNIDIILDAFKYIEPILNIGPDIPGTIAPSQVSAFMARHGFDEIDLGLFPTVMRAREYGAAWPAIMEWFRETLALSRSDGHFTMSFIELISNVRKETEGLDIAQFSTWLSERLSSQIYFDARGAMHPVFSGVFGNVLPMLPRFGFQPAIGGKDNHEEWKDACDRIARRVISRYSSREPCLSCPHMTTCAGGGAILFEQALGKMLPENKACPIGVRSILDDLAAA